VKNVSHGLLNLFLERSVNRLREQLINDDDHHCEFVTPHAVDRTCQEALKHLKISINKVVASSSCSLSNFDELTENVYLTSGVSLDLSTGNLKIKPSFGSFRIIIRYCGRWILACLSIVWMPKNIIAPEDQTCLLYGLPNSLHYSSGEESKFDKYRNIKPIPPIADADHILVQISNSLTHCFKDKDELIRFPEMAYLRRLKLSFLDRAKLFLVHVTGFFLTNLMLFRQPWLILVLEDLAVLWVYRELLKWGCYPRIVLTTSDLYAQPIWMRIGPDDALHCLHYATIPQVLVRCSDSFPIQAERLTHMLYLARMHHWVWFETEKNKIKKLYGVTNVSTSGVPEFILENPVLSETGKILDIVVFDVTPVIEEIELKTEFYYYGRVDTAKALITHICEVCSEVCSEQHIRSSITLKQKRKAESRHEASYEVFLNDLQTEKSFFKRVSPDMPISNLLSKQTLVIARPFTSIGFVSASLGVQTLFYDPTFEIINNCPASKELRFVQGKTELKKAIENHVLQQKKLCFEVKTQ
jgi:hypothetical protein